MLSVKICFFLANFSSWHLSLGKEKFSISSLNMSNNVYLDPHLYGTNPSHFQSYSLFFVVNGITIPCWYSIILRVLYDVKFIGGGIHVREAVIRCSSKGKFQVPQNVMTQNSSQKNLSFLRRENDLSTDDAKN